MLSTSVLVSAATWARTIVAELSRSPTSRIQSCTVVVNDIAASLWSVSTVLPVVKVEPMAELSAEEVLTTTRAVRRRMDLTRPVEPSLIRECLELALQAPNGSNIQGWHFVVVTDAAKRAALADLYRRGGVAYAQRAAPVGRTDRNYTESEKVAHRRVMGSAGYLYEHIAEVPALLIPCIYGRFDGTPLVDQATWMGSILPAVWSFMLAARTRGSGHLVDHHPPRLRRGGGRHSRHSL